MTVHNPITGAEEPYFPETQRLSCTLTGNMVTILMIAIVLIFLIAIILYRTILSIIIYRSQNAFFIFSAFLIAFTSDFLPRLFYRYTRQHERIRQLHPLSGPCKIHPKTHDMQISRPQR